jgi:peroxidase
MPSSAPPRAAVAAGVLAAAVVVALCFHGAAAQLCEDYYDDTCPDAYDIVKQVLIDAHKSDVRIYASLIRLHFHDCFVLVPSDLSARTTPWPCPYPLLTTTVFICS